MGLARLLQPEELCRPIRPIAAHDMPRSAVPQIRPLHVCQKHVEWGLGHAYNFWIKLVN